MANHQPEGEDNKDQVVLKDDWFINMITDIDDIPIHNLKEVIAKEIKRGVTVELGKRGYILDLEDKILWYRGLVFIPKPLRRQVIKMHHDHPTKGHPGFWKTYKLIRRNYWWDEMHKDVTDYVKSCPCCQQTKIPPFKPSGLMIPTQIPSCPWEHITTNMIVQLPESQGYTAILVVVDKFSKMMHNSHQQ
jgi:hypothetical protein